MDVEKTSVFEDDIKRLNADQRSRLQKVISRTIEYPVSGKQIDSNVYSIRIGNKRLIYEYFQDRILLKMFKLRDEVYRYLRES